jgi:hypothetical protein
MGKQNKQNTWVYITYGDITAPSWPAYSLDGYLNLQSTDDTQEGFHNIIFYT